ncbi:MAG: 16S rRNA (guanine(966)-N(2))-methyltransferase RsmD [Anaerolineales bacterium]|nr:16S rRNA (guanine(966)-N(2))-methyltransferase RsmD [Anaerolineales bacterium]
MPGIRVIAGSAKGRKLYMVPGEDTRPIGDRPKEALFNILTPEIEDAYFLDLFAGTGSVGIEALSRGAAYALFLDTSRNAIRTSNANLELTGLFDKAKVLHRDAFLFLREEKKESFDYIFIAPPQYQGLWEEALLVLDEETGLLNPDAWIIVQIHPDEYKELQLINLVEFDQRKYGNTLLVFYEYPGE